MEQRGAVLRLLTLNLPHGPDRFGREVQPPSSKMNGAIVSVLACCEVRRRVDQNGGMLRSVVLLLTGGW
jgi:hypothetical protein